LTRHVGELRIDRVDGRAVKRWFAEWRTDPDGSDHLPRARMVLAVLKAAVSFGIVCRYSGCKEFQDVVAELTFKTVPSRTFAPTAQHIEAARQAAHAAGAPLRALLYALVYDTTGREFDFLGQWLPLSDKKPSAIISRGKKWIGPMWSSIDDNLMMKIKPTKTEDTTGVEVTFDLSVCPMVMEELAMIDQATRHGPLIVNHVTSLPYIYETFRLAWHADFEAAGVLDEMWCRDMRAGRVTEGGQSGASKDDRREDRRPCQGTPDREIRSRSGGSIPPDHEISRRVPHPERLVNRSQDRAETMGPDDQINSVVTIACRLQDFVFLNELLNAGA
jgi:hypothetical protein